jgi:hypothetical protein
MAGVDIGTIQELGGWKENNTVEKLVSQSCRKFSYCIHYIKKQSA